MEALMKLLVSAMALAVALAWPAVADAQSKKAKARSATAAHQQHVLRQVAQRQAVQRHSRLYVSPSAGKPCAARTWAGCQGWDPDPNVRMMIQMDAGRDDQ
jgi:hypothetical protein